MGWHVHTDHLDGSAVGTAAGSMEGETFAFRLRDDDGELYYTGSADAAAGESDDDSPTGLYGALQWAAHDAGATTLEVRAAAALRYGLTTQAYLDAAGVGRQGWVSIYG